MFPQPPAPTDGAEAARGPRGDTESRASARLGVGARYARRRRQAALGGDDAAQPLGPARRVAGRGAGAYVRRVLWECRGGAWGPVASPCTGRAATATEMSAESFWGEGRGAGSARRAARERGEGSTVSSGRSGQGAMSSF